MLHLTFVFASSLHIGTPARSFVCRNASPMMMPKFLKTLFPDLEKPDGILPDLSKLFQPTEPLPEIDVKAPSAAIVSAAGSAMPLLAPVFAIEADLQAAVTNFGSYDEDAIRSEIESVKTSAPVVVYTYGLSPFSTEALSILESTGCEFANVPLGLEWFALGGKGSATRVQMRKMYGQGSLPHVFIGGEWVGGLATGADGGLAGLVERGELVPLLRKAKAL